jgi:endogenous inhibitor of DNA gyrase (YacG/DUF329 family)
MKAGCSICGKPVDPAVRPFCSTRCANVDLQRWLVGGYTLSGDDRSGEIGDEKGEHPPPSDED